MAQTGIQEQNLSELDVTIAVIDGSALQLGTSILSQRLLLGRCIPFYRRQHGLRNLHCYCSFSGRFSPFFASLSGENSSDI